MNKAEINDGLDRIAEKHELTNDRIKRMTLMRLDRIAYKLERAVLPPGLEDEPIPGNAVIGFRLLAAAIGIAARGLDCFTDEEITAFEDMAHRHLDACLAERGKDRTGNN